MGYRADVSPTPVDKTRLLQKHSSSKPKRNSSHSAVVAAGGARDRRTLSLTRRDSECSSLLAELWPGCQTRNFCRPLARTLELINIAKLKKQQHKLTKDVK